MKENRERKTIRSRELGGAAVFVFALAGMFVVSAALVYAEIVSYNSPLIWRADGKGDYDLPKYSAGKTYELTGYVKTVGQIETITLNCAFTGEVKLEASANGGSAYAAATCGVPLTTGFGQGNKLKWRITLGEDTEVSEIKVSYTDDSGVRGPLGEPALSGFSYRRALYISNTGSEMFNYPVKVLVAKSSGAEAADIDCGGAVREDFGDVRFTAADRITLLPYYLENISGDTKPVAAFLVKVSQIPTGSLPIYIYYGNSAAKDLSDADKVFDLSDDFTAEELDMDKWEKEVSEQGSVSLAYSQLKLESARVVSKDYKISSGIIDYRATAGDNGEVWAIVRGREGASLLEDTNQVVYSSKYTGAEHCIAVGEIVKANEEKIISVGAAYDYRVILNGTKLTFQRFAVDSQTLLAEVTYDDADGLTSGMVGFKAGSGGVTSFDWIRARPFSSYIEVNKEITAAAGAEAVVMPSFNGIDVDKKGNLVLAEDEESGEYVCEVVPLPYTARIFIPEYEGDNLSGQMKIDVAMDGVTYALDRENGKFYYASQNDFTSGDKLKFKVTLESTAVENLPQVKRAAIDYRPGKITLVSPNGGEILRPGKSAVITWSAWDYESSYPMRLEYSLDNGKTYKPITNITLNTGTYTWTVPAQSSATAKVKVCDKSAPDTVFDAADAVFSISDTDKEDEDEIGEEEEVGEEAAEDEELSEEDLDLEEPMESERRPGTKLYDVLIKVGDQYHRDAKIREKECFKDGDIAAIQPTGYIWGADEREKYLLVQMYLTQEEAENLLKPEERLSGKLDASGQPERKQLKKRRYRVNLDKLGITAKNFKARQAELKDKAVEAVAVEEKSSGFRGQGEEK